MSSNYTLNVTEVLKDCSVMSTDSNSLAREFLTDVNRLCNAVVQRVEAREEEDEEEEETHMAALGQYLVHGRGFLLLTKLDSIIDQALTCREELLTLLLSLLPLVWKIPVQEEKATDFNLPFSADIILTKEKNLSSQRSTQEKLYLEGSAPSGQVSAKVNVFRKSRRQRKTTHRYSVRDARKTQLSTSDSEADSDDRRSAVSKHRRPHQLQPFATQSPKENEFMAQPDHLSTKEQTPPDSVALESLHEIMPGQEANTDILSEPAALSIISHMNNSPFDLCHVLLSLLEKVCRFDITLNRNSALAASVVPTLTEFLAGFGDCCDLSDNSESQMFAAGWTEEPVALIQRMLFRTVLYLMSVDISTAEMMPESLKKNLTELLRAALKIRACLEKQPDPFEPRQKKTLQEVQEGFVFSKYRHRALLLPELLEGVLQILICCLQSAASNPFFFSQAMDLVQEFIQHHGFNLFETSVLQMEWLILRDVVPTEASQHLKALINSVMKIMSTVKKVKSEQLHHSMCTRKRHRRCEYSHFMHHHRDLSGLLVSAFKNQVSKNPFEEAADGAVCYPERCCCLAVCAHQCLRLLQQASLSSTCVQVLAGVQSVGVCCCMDPKSVIFPLLHAFRLPALKNFQQHILNILNKLILDQLGGAEIPQKIKKAACNICTVDSDQLAKLEETLQGPAQDEEPSSGLSSPYRCQGILPSNGSEDLLWRWDALEAYQDFVFEEDRLHSVQIANHICNLIQKGNVVVQWKLYNFVFNPVLQRGVELARHCQHLSVTSAQTHVCSRQNQCLPQEVLQVYLKTLPTLLKSRVIRDLFLSCNGVSQIVELNYLDGIRGHSLKAFETLIISLGEQQKESSVPDTNGMDVEQKELTSSLNAVTSFHNQPALSDSPQSLGKFYASLRDAYPKKRKSVNQDVHINTIHLFLCVALLCVSKEADSDGESTHDSEDTSGYDSTASEPLHRVLPRLPLESLVLPSPKHMHQAADVWSMCRRIYMLSPVVQEQFYRLGGVRVCHRLIFMIIEKLFRSHEEEQGKKAGDTDASENQESIRTSPSEITVREDLALLTVEGHATPSELSSLRESADGVGKLESRRASDTSGDRIAAAEAAPEEAEVLTSPESQASLQSIRLLEALLAICLHSSRASQHKVELELPDQTLSVENILLEMRDHLSQSKVIETKLAKPLFDALLRVALGDCSADSGHSEAVTEKSHQSEEEWSSQPGDFPEEAEDAQCCSFKLLVEEEGYEADSESNPEDSETREDGVDIKPEAEGLTASNSPNDARENLTQGEIIYPEICMLELNLLSTSKAKLDVLAHVFESFLKIVQQKEKNVFLLMQQGTVKNLLGGFLSILTQADSDFQACQRVLVDLLVSLMSSRTCSEELTLLLRIFLEKSPCTEILLQGILKIVESDIAMSPLQYLTFPLPYIPNSSSGASSQKSPGILNSKALGLWRRARVSWSKKEAESDAFPQQLLSSWHVAPVHLPLLGQNCWPHLSEGFSVSLWFSMECVGEAEGSTEKRNIRKRKKSFTVQDGSFDGTENRRPEGAEYTNPGERLVEEGCIHMVSLGSRALMIQVWADPHTGTFTFRVCMDSNDDTKAILLAQAESQENVFLPSKWQHLVLTYLQQPQGKKNMRGEVSIWVSGQRKPDVTLDFMLPRKTSLSSESNKTFCMIGHCLSSQEEFLQLAGKWDLGNLLLFNGAKIGSQEAFYLYACGPNHTSVMPCKYGKPVNDYSKYINKEILQCEQIQELFMTSKDVDIGLLIESLSIVYTTCSPAQYTIYEPVIRLKGQVKAQLSQRPFSSKDVQSVSLELHHLRNLRPTECKTLQGILHEIGGTAIFVFLFARVVELSTYEETQALALRVLLSLIKYNQQRVHELENCNGLSMIHQVLIKQKCTVGFHVLQTLLEGCCGEDILHVSENGEFKLDVDSKAIIQDVQLLEELLLDWKIWNKAEPGVWATLLAALEVLIRADHPQQMFNVKQLLKARVVHHFLLTCQVLQEHKEGQLTSIPREVCRSFVKIIAEVLGSPPDLELLTIIFNFLLAVHPPTNTYVCHNPTNFYFSLHIDGKIFQEKVESMVYLRHSISGGRAVPSPGLMFIRPSAFTASTLEAGSSSSKITPPQTAANLRRSRSLPALPASHLMLPQKLTASSDYGIDKVQSTAGDHVACQPEKWHPPGSSERLKKEQEDTFLSSCESAKTVCEVEAVLSGQASGRSGPKGMLEFPVAKVDHKELEAEPRADGDSPGDESCPQRPDYLKGLASFQQSQSTTASLGLAFPSQNGSAAVSRWPSLVDRNTEDWESLAFSPGYEPDHNRTADAHSVNEDCLVPICRGLYELLSGVLLVLPDAMLEDVMGKLIQADALLVLVNHPSPAIQQGVIKLLDAYFNRASKELKDKFLKNRGFSLLANQLYLHRGTRELLECFIEMFFGRHVGLEEEFELEDVKSVELFQKWAVIPVLGLVETSLYDNALLHMALLFLLQMLNSCSKVADMLLDNGLLYVLCNTVAALNGLEKNMPLNEYKLLACDIQQLFIAVTVHACSSSGSQYFRVIEDLIVLLGYLQNSKNKRTQNMAVALQFRVLQAAMEFIRTTANHDSENLTNSFQLPSSPPHTVSQKRKSIAGSIPMKGSTASHLPRHHFRSYGQLPMPFSFSELRQDSFPPFPPGSTPCVVPLGAGPWKFPLAQTDSLLMKMRSVASDELHVMMQRRMSQENPVQATEAELAQRLQRLTILAVNRVIHQEFNPDIVDILSTPENATQSKSTVSQTETEGNTHHERTSVSNPFQKEIFTYLVDVFKVSIGSSKTGSSRQQWMKIIWSGKETFRKQLGSLLAHILSPAHPSHQRKQIFEIVREPNYQEILRDCLSPSLQHGAKLVLYLSELIHNHQDELTQEELDTAEELMNALKLCGHKCIPPSAATKPELLRMIKEEQKKYETEEGVTKATWHNTVNNNQQSLFQRLDSKSKDISKIAADITQAVSFSQGIERKKVIQHIRGMYKVDLSASRHWQELSQQLTHDRAVWYDPMYYPTSWQLDPTEGPNRERRRLQRCYLTIPNKYLLRDRQKSEDVVKPPLSYLFEDKTHSSFSSTVKDKAASESIRVNRRCISVAPSRETAGELLLGKCGMYFVEDNASDTVESSSPQGELEPASFSWTYEEIKEVHKRWWQLRDNAVEIFLTNGRTLLLAFDNTKVRDDVYHSILTNNLPNLLEYGNITALTNLWYTGQITNFEYLTHLNKHAGRSFNDLMQYPVFPFILADYVSETLDLSDPSVYRTLSKPIAVQYKEKEDRYVDTYKYLEEEYRKGAREDDPLPPVQPYHYGSHYSNSGTVLHFLVRMPPFTRMFLAYQDQSFDIPDRTFHSMNTTWRLSSFESMTDVKELIPEFFYLPEFLVNREGFDFGVRQNGERVNHVNLPPWARNDPRLFILIHRQALESEHVSQNICQWIDLVFGYKQKGKASVQAINVFHPATYFGMDVSAVEDPVQRRALETMIKTYGQTPRQLFQSAHVSRPGSKLNIEGELPVAVGLLVQFAFRETREQVKEITYPSPLSWIRGLKWGEYVGSPSAAMPVVCFSQPHGERLASLQALPTRAICGLSRNFCLLVTYSKEQGVRSMNSTDIQWSAILSWGYADNILRLKSKQSEPPINFIQSSQQYQVTSCAWVPDSCQLFTGSRCGVITAYANRLTSGTPSEIEMESQVHLYGHTEEVTSLFVCKPYSILISVSRDGTCVIWDLNRLCYVQTLAGHKSPVTAVSASETTGDIATVCDSAGGGSDLRLWTVNGDLVGHVHCREIICSVAFSNQPEGVSVNVIAGGLENGVVRLWSTWDLKPVREITFPKSNQPIVSLTFSCDGHHLYTANSEGTVIAWCRKDQQRLKQPMFYSFLSSYAAG
ncbi:lysosomal-trafficking regulator isoform X1 [Sturnira hondurensis]|uniref:lysosomal-trafficking regulator isoform X1 n=1 Tax=Sturnira hondurensis TaxID=192404 RepID=UPI00187AD458|nr:lysosomal-trafficking regulator isoform X1 [Sturnira hondurensis]XP_036893215.1 lysosomal-trafficking regulator isoform X1 [Sturnira hondurensis]